MDFKRPLIGKTRNCHKKVSSQEVVNLRCASCKVQLLASSSSTAQAYTSNTYIPLHGLIRNSLDKKNYSAKFQSDSVP